MGSTHFHTMNAKLIIAAVFAIFSVSTVFAGSRTTNCGPSSRCHSSFLKYSWPAMVNDNFSKFPTSALNSCSNWKTAKNKVIYSTKPSFGDLLKRKWRVEHQTTHKACGIKVRCDGRGTAKMGEDVLQRFRYNCVRLN